MKKNCLVCGGVFIVAILVVAAVLIFGGSGEINKDNLSEIEKYALFRAELTCQLSEYGTNNMWQAMTEIPKLADEYGYAVEEVESFEIKYEENNEFWLLVKDYMEDMCPEVIDQLGLI